MAGVASRRTTTVLFAVMLAAFLLVPSLAKADPESRQQRDSIRITKDSQFDAKHGVRSGSGTAADPYVISGWNIHHLEIEDTASHVLIQDNTIQFLVLDWAGPGLHVLNNDIGDLRVNQNVKRTGEATSGLISNNTFDVVGQLRHFDGIFSNNVVGRENSGNIFDAFFRPRAVNFDGFNGAIFEDNVIYGYMDARLHGHHHSSDFEDTSHYHGTKHHDEMVDHSQRYHQVWIRDNTIYTSGGYALAYLDTAHSVNDRTAASERDEALNRPHVHYTRVNMLNNKLVGGGLLVDVFNAKDERHTGTAPGSMVIKDNNITLMEQDQTESAFETLHGITVWRARDLSLKIIGNKVAGPSESSTPELDAFGWWDTNAGILLSGLDKGTVEIYDNTVIDRGVGVQAQDMSKSVRWIIRSLRTNNVEQDVAYDDSVKNPPERKQ